MPSPESLEFQNQMSLGHASKMRSPTVENLFKFGAVSKKFFEDEHPLGKNPMTRWVLTSVPNLDLESGQARKPRFKRSSTLQKQ